MTARYTWLPGEGVKGTIEPTKPADGLPAGQAMTAEERSVWRALWTDRLARSDGALAFPKSEWHAHSLDSDCLGPMLDGVKSFGTSERFIRQPGWFRCDRYEGPIGLIHFHGDRAWHHEPGDRVCPVPEGEPS